MSFHTTNEPNFIKINIKIIADTVEPYLKRPNYNKNKNWHYSCQS